MKKYNVMYEHQRTRSRRVRLDRIRNGLILLIAIMRISSPESLLIYQYIMVRSALRYTSTELNWKENVKKIGTGDLSHKYE